jgi:outer membrane biosynthesis protein TonB
VTAEPSPEPTVAPEPTVQPEPEPTVAPEPTVQPEPTVRPEPEPTVAPEPTVRPDPDPTVAPDPDPEPTETVEPGAPTAVLRWRQTSTSGMPGAWQAADTVTLRLTSDETSPTLFFDASQISGEGELDWVIRGQNGEPGTFSSTGTLGSSFELGKAFSKVGTFEVTLTVTDAQGRTATDTLTVVVEN